jgi:hypothetical protein
MVCADKYNLFVEKNTTKKSTKTLLGASKEAGLQQESSHIFAVVPTNKIWKFQCATNIFVFNQES